MPDMPLELTQPWMLLGLLALPVLVWYFYRGLTDFSRWQRVTSLVIRSAVIVLLVVALCGLSWLKPSRDLYVVFVVDDSESVGDEARPAVEAFLYRATAAAGPHKAAFLRFGKEPGHVANDRNATVVVNRKGTN